MVDVMMVVDIKCQKETTSLPPSRGRCFFCLKPRTDEEGPEKKWGKGRRAEGEEGDPNGRNLSTRIAAAAVLFSDSISTFGGKKWRCGRERFRHFAAHAAASLSLFQFNLHTNAGRCTLECSD